MQDWKKSLPQDWVSFRGHFAPRLFLLSSSFFDKNSSAKICMALKRHTVLYRLRLNIGDQQDKGDSRDSAKNLQLGPGRDRVRDSKFNSKNPRFGTETKF